MRISQLFTLDQNKLIVVDGIITKRYLLPFFMPHLISVMEEDGKVYEIIPPSAVLCNTSIRLANEEEINQYKAVNERI